MEPNLKALKRAYKSAKKQAEGDPTDEQLAANYRAAKQR
jgi:hypothetical protein